MTTAAARGWHWQAAAWLWQSLGTIRPRQDRKDDYFDATSAESRPIVIAVQSKDLSATLWRAVAIIFFSPVAMAATV
jgi:hypothetical protein